MHDESETSDGFTPLTTGPTRIAVIGGGMVGENAIQMAVGMGADITVLDRNLDVLNHLSERFGSVLTTMYSTNG